MDRREKLSEEERSDSAAQCCDALSILPWDVAQDALGAKGADFISIFGKVLLRHFQDEMRIQVFRIIGESTEIHPRPQKTRCAVVHDFSL